MNLRKIVRRLKKTTQTKKQRKKETKKKSGGRKRGGERIRNVPLRRIQLGSVGENARSGPGVAWGARGARVGRESTPQDAGEGTRKN